MTALEPYARLRIGTVVDRSWSHLIDARDDGEVLDSSGRIHSSGQCSIPSCIGTEYSFGMCRAHYCRWYRMRKRGIEPTVDQLLRVRKAGRPAQSQPAGAIGGGEVER